MSYTDPSVDPVQPDPGQGGGDSAGDPPYADLLNRIPESVRGEVEPVLRDWDAQTTQRFQEASEFRRQWEPYQATGVNRYDPDSVEWALSFFEAQQTNPAAVKAWYDAYAQEHGLAAADAAVDAIQGGNQVPAQTYDEFGVAADTQALEQALKAQIGPLQQQIESLTRFQQEAEAKQREAEAERYLASQVAELKDKHPDAFADTGPYGAEQMIGRLQEQYINTDPLNAVPRAFADYQAIVAQVERNALQGKVNQPPAALSGGAANGAVEAPKTLSEARERANAFLAQAISQQ